SARGGRDQSGPARARDLHRPLLGDPAAGPRLSSQLAAPSTASLEPRPDKTPPRTQPAHPTARVQRRRPALPRRLLRPLHQQPRRTGPANDEGQDEDLRRLPHLRGRMRLRRRALARCNRPQARLEHPPDPNRPPSFPHSDPVRVTPTLGVTKLHDSVPKALKSLACLSTLQIRPDETESRLTPSPTPSRPSRRSHRKLHDSVPKTLKSLARPSTSSGGSGEPETRRRQVIARREAAWRSRAVSENAGAAKAALCLDQARTRLRERGEAPGRGSIRLASIASQIAKALDGADPGRRGDIDLRQIAVNHVDADEQEPAPLELGPDSLADFAFARRKFCLLRRPAAHHVGADVVAR